ncbi:MAG: hypothetical protein V3V60_08875 [Sphingomonas aquatilis]
MWNSTGTVSVTNGSPVVTGAGTVFSFPNAQPGQAFVGPNGLPMEIASVDSASQITLARPYGGATAAGQPFTILPTQSFANDLALAFAGFKNTAGAMLDTIGQGMFPDGAVAAPGIRFSADQDTGLRRVGENNLALVSGGVDKLGIDAAGAYLPWSAGFIGARVGDGSAYRMGLSFDSDNRFFYFDARTADGSGTFVWRAAANVERMRLGNDGRTTISTGGGAVIVGPLDELPNQYRAVSVNGLLGNNTMQGIVAGGGDSSLYVKTSQTGNILFQRGTTETARIDGDGNLLVGVTSAGTHTIFKNVASNAGKSLLDIGGPNGLTATFFSISQGAAAVSGMQTALSIARDGTTTRSLNATGTINASGADYAEYVRKSLACGTILKGDVCGIDSNGELTRIWSDARRYVVKSTDPNLVGGDTWAAHLGPRPQAPLYAAPAYDGPAEPTEADGRSARDAYTAAQDDYAKAVAAAEAAHAAAVEDHAAALTAWEAELEAARQTVDRIAFSGQVPVNVDADTLAACQAALGDGVAVYLVAVANGDGIGAAAVRETDMTLPLYMRRLGAVWAIRDGRPWVDVQHG